MSNDLIVNPELIYRIARDRMLDLAPGLSALPANDLVVEPVHYLPHLSHPVSLVGIRPTDNGEQLLVVGTVPANTRATIHLPVSQPGVRYQLYTKAGAAVGPAQDGDCDPLIFETDVLPKTKDGEYHEFYLEAYKINTAAPASGDRRLRVEVWINAGHDDGVDPSPMHTVLQYGEGYDLNIPDAPPNVQFTIWNRAGYAPYDPQTSGKQGGLVTFPIPALYENDTWDIHTLQVINGVEFGLIQRPTVYVYPNPSLLVMWLDQTPIPYLGEARLVIHDSQASCIYAIQLKEGHPPIPLEPHPGNGGMLNLSSIPLVDDCILLVKATKVEGDLSLYLTTETFIPVYPNPTLFFYLTSDHIAYGSTTRLIFDTPQHDVHYTILNEWGLKIGAGYAPAPPGEILEWDLGPFDEDLTVLMRAFRHGVESLMDLRIPLYIGPNLGLQVSFEQSPFAPPLGSLVHVDQTQASTDYQLYKIPGSSDTWGDPIACAIVPGNGDRISLPTGPLEDFRYQFYVVARKRVSGMEGRLAQELEIELKVRPEIQAGFQPTTIDYNGQVAVQVYYAQYFTTYRLVDQNGNHLSPLAPYEPFVKTYFLTTNPLPEDLVLRVEGENVFTGHRALLGSFADILVYPNPNLDLLLEEDVVSYGNNGVVRIQNAQASVAYHIILSPLFPNLYSNALDYVHFTAQPVADGEFHFEFGPLTYPVRGNMIATKPNSGLSVTLDLPQLPFSLRTRPNHTLVPDIVDNEISFMEYGLVVVSPTEPLTYYELRDNLGNPIGPYGFNELGHSIALDCGPFAEDTDIYIRAFSELTQLESVTTTPARILVGPDPNFEIGLQEVPFFPPHGVAINVNPTQTSTDYTLYLIEGDPYAWMPGYTMGTIQPGNGGQIILHCGPLHGIRYLAYVQAKKRDSGMVLNGPSTVVFYAGIRTDCVVSLDDTRVPYGYMLNIMIEYTQPKAMYEVLGPNGQLLGSIFGEDEGALLAMTLDPIYEDGPLSIRVTNLLTGQSALLDAHPWVQVGPRGDLLPSLATPVVTWQGVGQIVIPAAQPGVRYLAMVHASNDPGWPNGYPYNGIFAQAINLPAHNYAITFANAMYDVELRIRALKDNGLDAWQAPILSLKVSPNPTLKARALSALVSNGQNGTVTIENPQPAVYYELRHAVTNAPISGRFYAGSHPGIPMLMAQHGANPGTVTGNLLRIPTFQLFSSTNVRVFAVKVINNLNLYLQDVVHFQVH